MDDYRNDYWRGLLEHNGLSSFSALWDLEVAWFEPPNYRRGGWSGVGRVALKTPDGSTKGVFIKRQENHLRRGLRHPIAGEPTFAAEIRNILAVMAAGVPTLEPIYYGQRRVNGRWRAVLVTLELEGYLPLNELMREWQVSGWGGSVTRRRQLIAAAADIIRRLHHSRLVHNALHPKHLFVRFPETGDPQVRLIDLEKMRRTWSVAQAARRDLDSLNRRARLWSWTDRMRFLHRYLRVTRLGLKGRRLWRTLAQSKIGFMRKHGEDG